MATDYAQLAYNNTLAIQALLGSMGDYTQNTVMARINRSTADINDHINRAGQQLQDYMDQKFAGLTARVITMQTDIEATSSRIENLASAIENASATLAGLPEQVAQTVKGMLDQELGGLAQVLDFFRLQLVNQVTLETGAIANGFQVLTVTLQSIMTTQGNADRVAIESLGTRLSASITTGDQTIAAQIAGLGNVITLRLQAEQAVEQTMAEALVTFLANFWDEARKFHDETQTVSKEMIDARAADAVEIAKADPVDTTVTLVQSEPISGDLLAEIESGMPQAV